ncbi:cuticle collagen 34-like isoform X2 [Passer domesticus]|uniref:cuticle collagen 34-like isoform X2 n=1 Tax=Passer domesticus TaxID=48849 RepID=UPI0030FEFC0A
MGYVEPPRPLLYILTPGTAPAPPPAAPGSGPPPRAAGEPGRRAPALDPVPTEEQPLAQPEARPAAAPGMPRTPGWTWAHPTCCSFSDSQIVSGPGEIS